jgi:hypothetical protein
MRAFRRRIATDQGHVDICRLCSGFGIPALNRTKPIAFEVQRMSIDDRTFDLPLIQILK